MKDDDPKPRYIPPGSCTWCGHRLHPDKPCAGRIRTGKKRSEPCPCKRHELMPQPPQPEETR